MVEKDTYIRAAMDEIERIKNDEDKYIEYELRERAIRDYMSQMKGAREEGIEQGEDRVNMLIKKLSESGRTDDIIRSASDREFQDRLFHELGL